MTKEEKLQYLALYYKQKAEMDDRFISICRTILDSNLNGCDTCIKRFKCWTK